MFCAHINFRENLCKHVKLHTPSWNSSVYVRLSIRHVTLTFLLKLIIP
jgi:hypothetical protein